MTALETSPHFGAALREDGVAFRIWAPSASSVDVVVGDGAAHAMVQGEHGFFDLLVPGIGAGARYRYRINGEHLVPDPASRFQPDDVHGESEVIDPAAYVWNDASWHGRPWEETVLYELHLGTFTPEGTYAAAIAHLDELATLGITAVELMPLSESPGRRNWGYDGVLPYAPERCYGRPEDLKAFVDAAHARGLMVFIDVVYNHFGPDGNYLGLYAQQFFTDRIKTPWGAAIDIAGPQSEPVRDFFIQNALYWLEEYHFDGIRFDAVHEIHDARSPGFLDELASTVKRRFFDRRPVHLVLENDDNRVQLLATHREGDDPRFDAQWNDDGHHALHVVATGEVDHYYADYGADPVDSLARALAQGFVYQGQFSEFRGRTRGASSGFLPPTSFVMFAQNHDQIGNRARGERIGALVQARALGAIAAIVALSPMIPLIFMGEEWNASTPFLFFCDFDGELSKLVTEGRRREFAGFPEFSSAEGQATIPDPAVDATFENSKLKWSERGEGPHAAHLALWTSLFALRRREIVPRLRGIGPNAGSYERIGERGCIVRHTLGDGSRLTLTANLGPNRLSGIEDAPGTLLFANDDGRGETMGPWTVRFHLSMHGSRT